jgi:hypothetical protein
MCVKKGHLKSNAGQEKSVWQSKDVAKAGECCEVLCCVEWRGQRPEITSIGTQVTAQPT